MPPVRTPQRQRIFSPGLGTSILGGLATAGTSALEQQRKLEQLQEQERLTRETKALDPDRQAKSRALELIQQSLQPQFGQGRVGPPTEAAGLAQEQGPQELQSLMQLLGKTGSQGVQVFNISSDGTVTAAVTEAGTPAVVPKGSRVVTSPKSTMQIEEEAEARVRGQMAAPKKLSATDATTLASAEVAMGAIDELLILEEKVGGSIRKGMLPLTPPFGSEATQTADLLLRKLETEIVTARGGKQLTDTEIRFIKQLLPNIFRKDSINIKALKDLRKLLIRVRTRIVTPTEVGGEIQVEESSELAPDEEAIVNRLVGS